LVFGVGPLNAANEIFGCRRLKCDKMDGDKPILAANRNCHKLSHVA